MKRLVLIAAALWLPLTPPAAPNDLPATIDRAAQEAMSQGVSGLSVAVSGRGHLIQRSIGVGPAGHAITSSTIFHIASVSKYLPAGVVLQLAEQHQLSLDADIRKYVTNAPTQGRHVTLAELLNHTSGIHSFTNRPDASANEALNLDHQHVLSLFDREPLDFTPGTSWRYDNSGFYLLGMAVEHVTGESYGEYIRAHLFRPLHMETASMCDNRNPPVHLAVGHAVRNGRPVPAPPMSWRLPFAAGGICATATDLIKWERALDSGKIISRGMLKRMRQPTALAGGVVIDYGFGTRIGELQGHRVFGHTGNGGGYSAILECFPTDGLTIVVLANSDPAAVGEVATAIARASLDIRTPALLDEKPPEHLVQSLVGTYGSDDGIIEQVQCGYRLCIKQPGGGSEEMALRWQGGSSFALDAGHVVRYSFGTDGEIWG